MKVDYLSAASTAKLVRAALKRSFPGTRFSVRSRTYAGGASISVEWMDGPAAKLVEAAIGCFAGGRFDGMIDMKIGVRHWLMPDGTAAVASNPGTEGSMGVIPAEREWMPHPQARLVHFGADFVFCTRRTSPALVQRVLDRMKARGVPVDLLELRTNHDGSGYIAARSYADPAADFWEREARVQVSRFMAMRAG